jgi:hypothetical protein
VVHPRPDCDYLLQKNNELMILPDGDEPFRVLVANFSGRPKRIQKGQIVGLADSAHEFPVLALAATDVEAEQDWQ